MANEKDKLEKKASEDKVEEVVEKVEKSSSEVEGTEANEPDLQGIAKALEEIKNSLAADTRETAIAEIKKTVEGVEKSVDTRMEELLKSHTELAADFKAFKEGLDGVEKRLSSVESSSAIKKSADVEQDLEKSNSKNEQKPFWSSAFLPSNLD